MAGVLRFALLTLSSLTLTSAAPGIGDDHGVSQKQGGSITSGCLNFTINPNPIYWPECAPSGPPPSPPTTAPSPTVAALLHARTIPDNGREDLVVTDSIAPRSELSTFITPSLDDDWGEPTCLDNCYGVSRLVAAEAADAFARAMADHYFTTLSDDAWLHW